MSAGAQVAWLADGRRLHLHHGPIDLLIEAQGAGRAPALARAVARFDTLLAGLVEELPALRRPLDGTRFADPVARRMADAIAPYKGVYVTPMAAVAGAVADEILAGIVAHGGIERAWVNNGGDIAFHLSAGRSLRAMGPAGPIELDAHSRARGMATSGRGGRSHSLGIADSVTVLAADAAGADVAATLIANAVDLPGHAAITRVPANSLSPDSDLGARPVTVALGPLAPGEVAEALARGRALAGNLRARGLIHEALLSLCGQVLTTCGDKEIATHA